MPKYELVITNDNELSPLKSTPLTLSVLELIGPQGIQGPEGPRGVIGVTDNGGDGSLEYDPTTGIFTYTGPSAAEVRDHFSNGTGVTITDGQISIGQSVATNDDVIFNNVTSDLTGNADTADALTFIVRNSTGATLTEGTAVYVSGIQGNTPEVSPARADSSATMPAFGLVQEDIAASGNGVVTTFGSLRGLDVANFGETGVTFSLGDTVYISATEAGKLTNAAPAGESSLIQNIGKIERSSPTTNMTIKVGGAGRTNATPNLDDGKIFIGNNSNQSVTSDLNSEVRSRVSATGDLGYDQNTGVFSFTERTAAGILTDLKTVDGATSGLDADLLDGQHGSYYLDWTNTNNKPDPTITLSGDLSGSVTLTDLASGTLEATIAADSVALGTDTTGNYVADVDGTANQIAVSYNPSEGGTPTIGLANDVTIPNNLTVSGDLTVNGTNTIVDSTTVAVADSLFKLAKDNTADSLDAGWYGVYNDGTEKYAGIARDASAGGKFILYDGLEVEPTTTVDTSGTGFNKATLKADIEGNVTGNSDTASTLATARTISLDGDVTGSVSFDGSQNVTLTAAVADDSHNHTIANIDNLQTALDAKQNASNALIDSDIGSTVQAHDTLLDAVDQDVSSGSNVTFGTITADGLNLGDNEYIRVGASGNEISLHNDGTNNYAIARRGSIFIQTLADNADVVIRSDDGAGGVADYFTADGLTGEALLHHYGSEKLATKATGVDVTGTVTADQYDTDEALPTSNPSLSLDFGNSVQVDPRINFSRASIGTYFDGQHIRTAGPDEPRIEYGTDGTVKGLLIEEQRTNLVTYSDFSSGWASPNSTTTAQDAVGPDGQANSATTLTNTASGNQVLWWQFTGPTGDQTASIFVKEGTSATVTLVVENGGLVNNVRTTFTFATETAVTATTGSGYTNVSADVEDVGGGWYRLRLSFNATTAAGSIRMYAGNYVSVVDTETVLLYGAQLEAGSFPTSYIPTSGSQQTRSADVASIPVTAFGYNDQAGTIVVDFDTASDSGSLTSAVAFSDGTTNNRFTVRADYAQSWHTNGTNNGILNYTSVTPGTFAKISFAIDADGQAGSRDGGTTLTDPILGMPTGITTAYIGSRFDGGSYYLNGHIRSLKYWPQRLSDATLQAVTQG